MAKLAVAADPGDYLPLNKGCEWTADGKVESARGSVLTGTAKAVLSDEEVEKDGKRYLRKRTTWDLGKVHNELTELVRKDGTGVYSIIDGAKETSEQREIVLPLKVGETWTVTVNEKTLQVTVIGLETVTIDGKSYEDCFHIRRALQGGGFTEDVWEAPKIGAVKSEGVYADGTKMFFTLREFKPGK